MRLQFAKPLENVGRREAGHRPAGCLLLVFLVLSILPGVRALGGSHQPVYYPLMRYVICHALEASGLDADLQHALATDDARERGAPDNQVRR